MILKAAGVLFMLVGIVVGVFLASNPQILRSRADGSTLLTSFLAAFGSNFEEDRYDSTLDINADGVINIIDVLESRKLETEDAKTQTDSSPTPTDEPSP